MSTTVCKTATLLITSGISIATLCCRNQTESLCRHYGHEKIGGLEYFGYSAMHVSPSYISPSNNISPSQVSPSYISTSQAVYKLAQSDDSEDAQDRVHEAEDRARDAEDQQAKAQWEEDQAQKNADEARQRAQQAEDRAAHDSEGQW